MAPGSLRKSLHVTVIAASAETREGLHGYFESAAVSSHTTSELADPSALRPSTVAVVLFPDEFEPEAVVKRVTALRRSRAGLLLVIVTGAPQHVRAALEPDGHSTLPVVLPKPAFGWTILDVIREHAREASP